MSVLRRVVMSDHTVHHARSQDGVARNAEDQRHDRIVDELPFIGIPSEPDHLPDETDEIEITAGQKMLSAMSGSLLTSLIVTPLDVVRVRLQSQPTSVLAAVQKSAASSPQSFGTIPPNLGITACCREVFFMNNNAEYCLADSRLGLLGASANVGTDCAVEETQRRTFNSTLDGLRKIARNEGITTLWRGLSPTLVMTVPSNIIYFTQYDWLRFNKASPIRKITPENYAPLVAGAFARTLAAFVVSPIEMFRTRMQASHSTTTTGHFAETFHGLRDMVHANGYRSLWRGITLTLWRDVPFSGFYWWGYEAIRGQLTDARERGKGRESLPDGSRSQHRSRSQSRENHTLTFADSFVAGATSGAIASILTMPFDVGKTRQQVYKDTGKSAANGAKAVAPELLSMPKFLMHIYNTEGISGLWRGWIPRTLKVAPACAIMISCYEVGKRMARSMNEKAAEQNAD